MVSYRCEWCKREKHNGQRWLMALAAERVTRFERRREIQVFRKWHSTWARHPLAVHFCSAEHLDAYVNVMFTVAPRRARTVNKGVSGRPTVELETQLAPGPAKHDSAPVERRPPIRAKKRVRQPQFTELDNIRAHGMGIVL